MRILQLKSSASRGGAETLVLGFTRKALERGHDVMTLFAEPGWLVDQFRMAGLSHSVLPVQSLCDVRHLSALVRSVRRFGPDAILAHGARSNWFGVTAGRLTRTPCVGVEHGIDMWRSTSRLRNTIDRWTGRGNVRRIAVSRAVADMLLERSIIPGSRIVVIPNAVEFSLPSGSSDKSSIRRRFGFDDTHFVAVTVARLVPVKGHRYLLEAAARIAAELPSVRFLLLGDGPLRGDLERRSEGLGLKNTVIFAGAVDDVASLLPAFDLFVLPSLSEGLPVALIEAMAARMAIVATRTAGTPEAIVHGETGLLVPLGDSRLLAQAIQRLVADTKLRERLGRAARAEAHARFAIDTMVGRYLEVLGAAVASRRSCRRALMEQPSTGGLE